MNSKEQISIIVPVYKVEKYLCECLDSILSSTYQNFEVILVDDGSPDRCGAICDEYAQQDMRIRVIHQENAGLVGARNAALNAAQGEYISFIDSDDMISPYFYEYMMQAMIQEDADLAGCEFSRQKDGLCCRPGEAYSVHVETEYEGMLAIITNAPSVRSLTWTGCNVWNKLYKRSFIQKMFDPECLMCEDLQFNQDYIVSCRKFVTISLPLYFYRVNPEGIMSTYRISKSKVEAGICHAELWRKISACQYRNAELETYLKARALYMAHGALWRIYASGCQKNYLWYKKAANQLARSNFQAVWADKESYNLRIRLIIAVFRYAPPLWRLAAAVQNRFQK